MRPFPKDETNVTPLVEAHYQNDPYYPALATVILSISSSGAGTWMRVIPFPQVGRLSWQLWKKNRRNAIPGENIVG